MDFKKITDDTTCDCLVGTTQDTLSIFARALNKAAVVDKDFLSKWDKLHRAADCINICGLKGVSISKIENEIVKDEVMSIYNSIFKIAPNYKRGVMLFNFKDDAGMVKPTPDETNKYHHDFYKADEFTLDFITQIEILYLSSPTSV